MTKKTGLILIGGAIVAGILYATYKLAQPNTASVNNEPNNVSSSVATPFNNLVFGVDGLVPINLPGDISNTTGTAQTNPGVV